jgi:hypothetical protein
MLTNLWGKVRNLYDRLVYGPPECPKAVKDALANKKQGWHLMTEQEYFQAATGTLPPGALIKDESVLEHLISTGQYFMPTDERVSHGGGNYGAKEAGVFGIGLHHTPNSGLPAMKLPIPEPTNAFMPQNAPTGPIPPGFNAKEYESFSVAADAFLEHLQKPDVKKRLGIDE